jgi:hypothetical protein
MQHQFNNPYTIIAKGLGNYMETVAVHGASLLDKVAQLLLQAFSKFHIYHHF